MKAMKKKMYVSPETNMKFVELEKGLMKASVFDPENNQDDGVSITGHEVGNEGDYTGLGWDNVGTNNLDNGGF